MKARYVIFSLFVFLSVCLYAQETDFYTNRAMEITLGRIQTLKGTPKYEQALKEWQQQAREVGSKTEECHAWNELADFYYEENREKELMEVYDTLVSLSNDYQANSYYYKVSSTASLFLLRQARINEAYNICLNTLERAVTEKDMNGTYVSHIMMARFFNTTKMNEQAVQECEQAMEIEKELPDWEFGTGLSLALNCSQESETWDKSEELIKKYGKYVTSPKYKTNILAKKIIVNYWNRQDREYRTNLDSLNYYREQYNTHIKDHDAKLLRLIELMRNNQYRDAQKLANEIDPPLQYTFKEGIFFSLNMGDSLFSVVKERNRFYNEREELIYNSDARKVRLENLLEDLTARNEALVETTSELTDRNRMTLFISIFIILFLCLLAASIYIIANRKYTQALQARNEQVEKANNFKTQFVQNMSHEVRTPLNAICGFSQILANPDLAELLSQEEKEQYSNIINSSTDMLTSLVNDILDIGDIESGKYRIYIQDIEVNAICQKAINTVEHRLLGKNVELRFESSLEDDFTIQSDPARIQQILVNFLTNAIKHTDEGSIVLSVAPLESMHVRFSVTDTGEGVAPENAEAIFQRFEKLNTFKQGTGLGLPICRSLADCMGGKVYLDTSYTAGGARFNLDL